jgi:hypothetical protein
VAEPDKQGVVESVATADKMVVGVTVGAVGRQNDRMMSVVPDKEVAWVTLRADLFQHLDFLCHIRDKKRRLPSSGYRSCCKMP